MNKKPISALSIALILTVGVLIAFSQSRHSAGGPETTGSKIEPEIVPVMDAVSTSSEDTRKSEHKAAQSDEPLILSPAVFEVVGISFKTNDPIGEYLDLEAKAEHDSRAALNAHKILTSCKRIPSSEDVTPEMDEALGLVEAREICGNLTAASRLEAYELVQLGAALGATEAILLLPSFPPPFIQTDNRSASESFLEWQSSTVNQLEALANQGNIDARLRLAGLYAGEFPAFRDHRLAYMYLEEVLRSEGITPSQERRAASLRSRLPKPTDS